MGAITSSSGFLDAGHSSCLEVGRFCAVQTLLGCISMTVWHYEYVFLPLNDYANNNSNVDALRNSVANSTYS